MQHSYVYTDNKFYSVFYSVVEYRCSLWTCKTAYGIVATTNSTITPSWTVMVTADQVTCTGLPSVIPQDHLHVMVEIWRPRSLKVHLLLWLLLPPLWECVILWRSDFYFVKDLDSSCRLQFASCCWQHWLSLLSQSCQVFLWQLVSMANLWSLSLFGIMSLIVRAAQLICHSILAVLC